MPLIIDREDLRDRPRDTEEAPPRRERRFELPRLMARMGGGFVIAPPKKEEVVKEIEWREGVNQTMEELKKGLLEDPTNLDKAVERLLSLVLLREMLDLQAPKVDLPYNAQQVPAGAQAVLDTVARVPEAEVMKPRIEGLEEDVEQHKVVKRVLRPIEQFYEVVKANEAVVLSRMGSKVEGAMDRVKSLMDNSALRRGLKEAVAVRQDPMEEAKKTRGDHKRVEAKAAAKAVAEVVAEGGVVPPGSGEVTQTTVTTTQPRSGPVLPPQTKSKVKP